MTTGADVAEEPGEEQGEVLKNAGSERETAESDVDAERIQESGSERGPAAEPGPSAEHPVDEAAEPARPDPAEPDPIEPEPAEGPAGPAPSLRSRWADRQTRVLTAAAVLAVVQLGLLTQLLSRQYFFQDDYELEHNASLQGLGWQYLMTPHNGRLMPGGMAVAWIVTRLSPMNWALAAVSIVLMQALASFAVLRLLRLVFGTRPAILALFAFYLFGAANVPVSGWWAPALEVLPLEAMLAFALGSHILYLRGGGRRDAQRTVGFSVLGLLFMAKAVAIPLLLFAVTVCYFSERPTIRSAVVDTVRRHWRIWSSFVVILGVYYVLYWQRLSMVHETAKLPDSISEIWHFSENLLGRTFAPVLFGGPWKWLRVPDSYQFSAAPDGLVYASWAALAALVAASLVFRARAARAWLILLGYLVVGDVFPILAGRVSFLDQPGVAGVLGAETRYVADAMVVAAVCIGLAFIPKEGETEPYRRPLPADPRISGLGQALIGALAVASAAGLAVSVVDYHRHVDGDQNRAWYDHARAALAAGTSGASILDIAVPEKLNLPWGGYDKALPSFVLSAVASPTQRLQMSVSQPVDAAFAFDPQGYLRPVEGLVNGAAAPPGPVKDYGYCFGGAGAARDTADITLPAQLAWKHWSARIVYVDHDASTLDVQFGIARQRLQLPPGLHTVTFNLPGSGSVLHLSGVSSEHALCVAALSVGDPALG